MSFLIASTYLMSSVEGFVSSNRRLQRPPNSCAMPKFTLIALTWPMCGKPLGSGGKRVAIGRPKRLLATSSATISRMKSRCSGGVGMAPLASNTELDTGGLCDFREVTLVSKDIIPRCGFLMTATAADRHRIPPLHLAENIFCRAPYGYARTVGETVDGQRSASAQRS